MTKTIKIFGVELESLTKSKQLKVSIVDDNYGNRSETVLSKTEVGELLEELHDWFQMIVEIEHDES